MGALVAMSFNPFIRDHHRSAIHLPWSVVCLMSGKSRRRPCAAELYERRLDGKVEVEMRIREWVREPLVTAVAERSRRSRRPILAGALVGLAIVATACGSSGASPAVSTKAISGTSPASAATVTVSSARVGAIGAVLVDQSGFTLYRYTLDAKDTSNCTGACAAAWLPLMVPAGGDLKAGGGLNAAVLGTIERPGGGRQVVFDGTPLYLYAGDKKAGEATGQGVAGTWFVATPSSTSASSSSTTTSPTSSVPSGAGAGTSGAPAPAVAPPMTEPPATSPPATSPPATSPPPTSPPPTSPPPTSSPATSPASTSPPATSPPTTIPAGGGYGY
jgi:predicted lipoprotein with Yx(FWY)xxD motif